MKAKDIFATFVKPIGIGAIAVSGIIGLIRMGKIVAGSISLGIKAFGQKSGRAGQVVRTNYDMNPRNVMLIQIGSTLLMGAVSKLIIPISWLVLALAWKVQAGWPYVLMMLGVLVYETVRERRAEVTNSQHGSPGTLSGR